MSDTNNEIRRLVVEPVWAEVMKRVQGRVEWRVVERVWVRVRGLRVTWRVRNPIADAVENSGEPL
jgi:hypothetical protein